MLCFECLEEIGKQRVCPNCGAEMFPTVKETEKILKRNTKMLKKKKSNKKNDEINQWYDMGLF